MTAAVHAAWWRLACSKRLSSVHRQRPCRRAGRPRGRWCRRRAMDQPDYAPVRPGAAVNPRCPIRSVGPRSGRRFGCSLEASSGWACRSRRSRHLVCLGRSRYRSVSWVDSGHGDVGHADPLVPGLVQPTNDPRNNRIMGGYFRSTGQQMILVTSGAASSAATSCSTGWQPATRPVVNLDKR